MANCVNSNEFTMPNGNHVNGTHSKPSDENRSGTLCAESSADYLPNGAIDPDSGHKSSGISGAANGVSGHSPEFTPVAICGMACRLPGNIESPDQLWDFLMSKGDARTRVPSTRYSVAGYHSSTKKPGAVASEYGYFLDESVDLGALDTSFFSMTRAEAERMDPQQRLLLEVSRESLDDAGETGWRGQNVGVYVGSFGNDWYDSMQAESQRYGMYHVTSAHDFALSNRVSYEMDLRGPSMTIRTACSSSLVCLNEACAAIAKGDCKSAIVGGTNIIMAPALTSDISEQGALSPDGSCKTFSSKANGYVRAEGVVALYVKPLRDALEQGNPVRAVIVGTATNSDGKTPGFTVPSSAAHEALIRHTYKIAGISQADISKTGFFECHGTGTPVGDPVETEAIARVFGSLGGIHIGSVKPNLGHGEGASGLTAVLKAVLSLEHRTIPPNIKSLPRNENIPFDDAKLVVPLEATEWPHGRHERVSVNSFGVGGANAHVIIDSAASFHAAAPATPKDVISLPQTPQLLVYSANRSQSLERMTARYQKFIEGLPGDLSLEDWAYTLANRREHLPLRSFAVGTRDKLSVPHPPSDPKKAKPNIVMVFTGQGSQWPQMGGDLIRSNETFRRSIMSLDEYLQDLGELAPSWSIEEELLKEPRTSRVYEAEFSQPLCTALQLALVDVLASVNIKPAAVVGHSSGEIAAAYAAGGITARDAIAVSFCRGLASKMQSRPGGMAAVGMSWHDCEEYLVSGVVRACDNSPNSVTLSGDVEQLQSVVAAIKKDRPDVPATILKVDKAYHSHHVADVSDTYSQMMVRSGVSGSPPSVPFFSSLTGGLLQNQGKTDPKTLGPKYWRQNLESPVLFNSAVSSILDSADPGLVNPAFLEVGPHSALSGPLRNILTSKSSTATYIATLARQKDSVECLLTAFGNCGYYTSTSTSQHSSLGAYAFQTYRAIHGTTANITEYRLREFPHHDLLGVRVPESSAIEPVWRNLLHLDNAPWLRDHKVRTNIVFPLAGYIAIAAEAARQITRVEEAVELRNVAVSTALVLREEVPAELVTTFRRHRLTDSQDSTWWEFTVSSFNGHSWTKHCLGQVRASTDIVSPGEGEGFPDESATPNKVPIRQWYERARRAGMGYGHHFTTLEDLRTSTTGEVGRATAKARNNWHGDEANYHLHPVLVDTYLQLMASAAHHGMRPGYRQLIPARVGSIALSRCSADVVDFSAWCEPLQDGFIGAGLALADSKTVLRSSGVTVFPLAEMIDADNDQRELTTTRPEWVAHIDFQPLNGLIRHVHDKTEYLPQVELLAQMAICLSQRSLRDEVRGTDEAAKSVPAYIQAYSDWLGRQHVPSSLEGRTTAEIIKQMDELLSLLGKTSAAPAAAAITKVQSNILSILSGTNGARELLSANDTLDELDEYLTEYDASGFLQCLGHSKPNLRVLELGAGPGAATAGILANLRHPNGHALYSQYVCSDVLPEMIASAKERLAGIPNLEFTALDIDQDPADQGLQDRQFDLIIATGAVHASPRLSRSLRHARKLLSREGRLVIHQPRRGMMWAKYVLGTMSDWWCGVEDGRIDEPYVTLSRWNDELVVSGFRGLDDGDVVLNSSESSHLAMTIVARPQPKASSGLATLLCNNAEQALSEEVVRLANELEGRGLQVSHCTLADSPPEQGDIIALLDTRDRAFFNRLSSQRFDQLRKFIASLEGSSVGLFWITNPCQTHCPDPNYSPVIGLARTVRSEMVVDFATYETTDRGSQAGLKTTADVFCRFQQRDRDAVPGPDFEFSVQNNTVRVNRLFPFSLDDELHVSEPSRGASLVIDRPGRLDTLHWAALPVTEPGEGEVQVEVHATGVNFKDVLIAAGVLDDRIFGHEAAGIVRQVGPKVQSLRIGDRVVMLELDTFSTVVTTPEILCEKLPDDLSFADAASMPLVYATSIYSLIDVARLRRGQSVLIHSGCGGVGIAAIQIARMLGAKIYTTVSSEDKVAYLTETFHIPRENIFHSRDTSFVEDLMRQTNGRGVDVALNSLSGELLHATWRCVAKFGMLVEIGKRDLVGGGKLDMDVFVANRSYCCVAIDQMRGDPDRLQIGGRLLKATLDYYRQGHIQPIRLAKVCSASAAREAFQYLQKGTHIGKVVMSLRDATGSSDIGEVTTATKKAVTLDPSASYLLVGGLGGLGRSIATWMVQHGARHLTFLARSAGSGAPHERDLVRVLKSMGCAVQLVRGSVTDAADVGRAIDQTPAPLKGIVQMSMVLKDQSFARMSMDEWDSTMSPKVAGTWNLHRATSERGTELDFFLLLSSLSGVLGQPGQANYAAANTFLDAFVLYRNGLGLPCTAVDVGIIEGAGHLFENDDLFRKMQGTGWNPVMEEQLLEALGPAMSKAPPRSQKQQQLRKQPDDPSWDRSFPSTIVSKTNMLLGVAPSIPLSNPSCSARLRKDARMAIYHNNTGSESRTTGEAGDDDRLRTFLAQARANPALLRDPDAAAVLGREIGRRLFSLLLKADQEEPDISLGLGDLGLDSMVAVEMRAWWKQVFGSDISVLQMMAMGTLEALGKRLADELADKYQG